MPLTGATHGDFLSCYSMILLGSKWTRVYRVDMVDALAHRKNFDDLFAHGGECNEEDEIVDQRLR